MKFKNGKHIKRTFRRYKRTRRASRKPNFSFRRKIRRTLNTLAEKKTYMFQTPNGNQSHTDTFATNALVPMEGVFDYINQHLIKGPDRDNRVGDKIFIRYIITKGTIYNRQLTAGATGRVAVWVGRETIDGSLAGKTRSQIIGQWPDTYIPDAGIKGYKWLRKKSGFLSFLAAGYQYSFSERHSSLSDMTQFSFKIKIPIFQQFTFAIDGWKIADGKRDLVIIPFIYSTIFNHVGTGILNIMNTMVTFTDM